MIEVDIELSVCPGDDSAGQAAFTCRVTDIVPCKSSLQRLFGDLFTQANKQRGLR